MPLVPGCVGALINDDQIRCAKRLCLFAHYHQDGILADHVMHYLRAIQDAGFTIVVLSTAALSAAECDILCRMGVNVILRENRGMDFGGWIEACMRFFPIQADLLLLANDSAYGPLSDLRTFIDTLTSTDADFYGALESLEVEPHLQSWFVLLRPAAYRSAAFSWLMNRPMPDMPDKLALVLRYEIGLTRDLVAEGLRYHPAFSLRGLGGIAERYPYNPAHLLWRELIAAGVPFLKIELLRLNLMRVTDTHDWRQVVGARFPAMIPMIEQDLAHRGVRPLPSLLAMRASRRVYWPELRWFILRDYKSRARPPMLSHTIYHIGYRVVEICARAWRRVQGAVENIRILRSTHRDSA